MHRGILTGCFGLVHWEARSKLKANQQVFTVLLHTEVGIGTGGVGQGSLGRLDLALLLSHSQWISSLLAYQSRFGGDQVKIMLNTIAGKPLTRCQLKRIIRCERKVMKALCYSAKLVAGYHAKRNPDLAKRYATASSKISGARATLRLIDDIPMIQYALEYGLGENEPDRIMAVLGVTANIVDLLYYPIEKVCWLAEHKIVDVKNADSWDNVNSIFWVLSVYLNLMRTMRNFSLNQDKLNRTTNINDLDVKTMTKHRLEMVSIARISLDFVHAVSTLPKGYLWGGKLSTFQVGAIGTLSAGLGIYQIFAKRRLNK